MAVDTRLSRDGKYVDRNKYYKSDSVSNMSLTANAVAQGVFYSTDIVALSSQTLTNGNVKMKQFYITIETPDYIPNLEVDDYVLYGADGELWIVDSLPKIEDTNASKLYSKRPTIKTHIVLRRQG